MINKKFTQFSVMIFILLLIIAFVLITPLGTDDGWIVSTMQIIANTGEFLWTAQDVNISFGKVYFYLNSLLMTSCDKYFMLKLFPAILTLVAILLYCKFILLIFKDKLISSLSIWLIIIFGVSTSIMLGLRTEGLYIPILFILFYLIYKYEDSLNYTYLYIASAIVSLSAITHPNGFVLVGLLFIFAIIKIVQKNLSLIHLVVNIVLLLCIIYYGLLWQTNLTEFLEGFNTIAKDEGHTIPFYKEYIRYIGFMREYPYLSIPLIVGFVGMVLLVKDFFANSLKLEIQKDIARFIVYGSIFVFLYLVFVGVKWGYYLALLFPFLIIGLLYLIKYFKLDTTIIVFIKVIFIFLILNLLLLKLPQNEEFLRLVHIPSGRIAIIDSIKEETKDKTVLTPIQTFFMFNHNTDIIPFEKIRYSKINNKYDYVVMDILLDKEKYEKNLHIKMKYIRSFVYNGSKYNLFKVFKR